MPQNRGLQPTRPVLESEGNQNDEDYGDDGETSTDTLSRGAAGYWQVQSSSITSTKANR